MNYLGHLRVAPTDPLVRIGNLLGDFMQGVELAALPAPLRVGVEQHRALDRFTDAHPAFRRSRGRVPPRLRRFAGVLVDVFYDHFLARDWHRWGDGRPLPEFTAEVYRDLRQHAGLLPERLARAAPRMAQHDWLGSYGDLALVDVTLARMAGRLRRASPLAEGGAVLRANHAALADDFAAFFPAVLERNGRR